MTTPAVASATSSAPTPLAAQATSETFTVTTRFGQVAVNPARAVSFPQGLFGFRECTEFALAPVPNMENSPLLLLQCLNQPGIAFLVADPAQLGLELKDADRAEALEETRFDAANTQFLVILTLYDAGESYQLTANLKAPVLIDTTTRTGQQFILSSKAYTTQHKL